MLIVEYYYRYALYRFTAVSSAVSYSLTLDWWVGASNGDSFECNWAIMLFGL